MPAATGKGRGQWLVALAALAALAAGLWLALRARRPAGERERFAEEQEGEEEGGGGSAGAKKGAAAGADGVDAPAAPPPEPRTVKQLRTQAGARAEVVDTGRGELGRCLLVNGRVQLCEREERKYHEMLVHFPCAYLPGGPTRVLIVGGADCMALREVLRYASVEAVVCLEEDEQLTSFCEQQFMTSRQAADPRVRFLFGPLAETARRLQTPEQLQTYDLVIVDTKERPGMGAAGSRDFLKALHTLMRAGGVLVKNGDGAEAALKQAFPHVLAFGFQSEAHVKHYRMAVGADVDLGELEPAGGAASESEAHRAVAGTLTFYSPARHMLYVPWLSALKKATGVAAGAYGAPPTTRIEGGR